MTVAHFTVAFRLIETPKYENLPLKSFLKNNCAHNTSILPVFRQALRSTHHILIMVAPK
jgi:hypothetical protein